MECSARTIDFNRGWRFNKGETAGAQAMTYDARDWETVRTPHDWAIAGPFDADAHGYDGKLPWRGVGWYRKWVTLDRREEGSQVYLDFDGVMAFPKVFVNGQLAFEWDYGYTPFRVDITRHFRFGRANVIAVRVDTRRHKTRWYPGAGIYRKVTLTVSPPVHLAYEGTAVRVPDAGQQQVGVAVLNEIENHLEDDRAVDVTVDLFGPTGEWIDGATVESVAGEKGPTEVRHELSITSPRLWDVDDPALYKAVTTLLVGGVAVERRNTYFGVRSFQFSAEDGFHLNGRRVPLRGVNLHHDLGPLGAAFNRRAAERQLELLQEMGVNAIRTAHNPPAREVLDLCDRMGLLVWVDLFDKWDETAGRVGGQPGFAQHMNRHAAALVRRDRNHPCVIAWGMGNEVPNMPDDREGKSRERIAVARRAFRKHDPTRPVGLACHMPHTAETSILDPLRLAGWNYDARYKRFRARYPQVPIAYTETASAVSSRGCYSLPLPRHKCDYELGPHVNAYEMNAAPWSDIPEHEFQRVERDHYLAGEFVWTGFDYLGEPTPFDQQARSSYFGVFDLAGLPKDRYYLYKSRWREGVRTAHLAPHWNWPGRVGQPVPVMLYTNGDSAELFLNGRSLGRRCKGDAPTRPIDLAVGSAITASSSTPGHTAAFLLDPGGGEESSAWRAAPDDPSPSVVVDLGDLHPLRSVVLAFERETKLYAYRIDTSENGVDWRTAVEKPASRTPQWGGVREEGHPLDETARFLRVAFGAGLSDARPGLKRLSVFAVSVEADYYRQTYEHRLRWNEVPYEPGELRAVTYRDGQPNGTAIVRTAGPPARLRLTADRHHLTASGEDLAFITVEVIDEAGVLCPLASDTISLSVDGPAEIAGVDAGDPTSLRAFQSDQVALFNGKAVVIVRAHEGLGGAVSLSARAPGLSSASVELESASPLDSGSQ